MDPSATAAPSHIGVRQNDADMQALLRARQWRWLVAARWQKLQLALLIGVPSLLLLAGALFPGLKPALSFSAVLVTLLDIGLVDRRYREALKSAARASENFDIALFGLEWNSLSAGKQPTPEERSNAARAWNARSRSGDLQDWYTSDIDRAPLAVARLICQRTNLTYDSGLRRFYVEILTCLLIVGGLVLGLAGIFTGQIFLDFVVGTWVPAAPFLFWLLRERFRQSDAVEANDPGIQQAEDILRLVGKIGCTDEECSRHSRLIQNAIFVRRATTPLLFPGIYRLRRTEAEMSMEAAARHWLQELGY